MNKKGFTLIELLAVIAILAVLVVIALPNVMRMFNDARKNSFLTEAQTIYKETAKKYMSESIKGNNIETIYSEDSSKLNLNGKKLDYCIILDEKGKAKSIAVGDEKHFIIKTSISDISSIKAEDIHEGSLNINVCSKNQFSSITGTDINQEKYGANNRKIKECTYSGDLVQGAVFDDDIYTYRYMQEKTKNSWANITEDGWGVALKDSNQTAAVTAQNTTCSTINGKPIVSMAYMFRPGVNVASIDASGIDTSNVTNMQYMFNGAGYNNTTFTLNLGDKFDTSKVTNMQRMFSSAGENSTVYTLDLGDKFDTSNVTNMVDMFGHAGFSSEVFTLNLGDKFDTSKVTNMNSLFWVTGYSNPTFTLDLGNKFDTSNVTNMQSMFYMTGYSNPSFTLDLKDKFKTSNVTNMLAMFAYTKATTLDLSSFDVSNASNVNEMFKDSQVNTVYVRTQADADKLNSGSAKPSGLSFIVKTN